MSEASGYGSPGAFRRALTDWLRAMAKTSRWTLPQLQRQFAYDRLLERLYLVDDGWIVKGATALLARDLGMRATVDIDLYRLTVVCGSRATRLKRRVRCCRWRGHSTRHSRSCARTSIGYSAPARPGPGIRKPGAGSRNRDRPAAYDFLACPLRAP